MKCVRLNDGNKMPMIGLGTFQMTDPRRTQQAVTDAIDVGYRLFDTASILGNESAIGAAIRESRISRDEFFITSKLWIDHCTYEKAKKGIDESLKRLGLDYLDLYLLHQPFGDVIGAWRAMEEAQKAGKIRSIGVANFMPDSLVNLELVCDVKPAVNQIEISPWYQRPNDVQFIRHEGITPEAWAPFAEGKHQLFSNRELNQIGAKYGKTNGQIILRWLLQRGIVSILKTIHKARMEQNIDVFDFRLSDAEMLNQCYTR